MVEREQLLDLVDHSAELLVAAEDDVVFLEVRRELHGHERIDTGGPDVVVAPSPPGILAAAHRPVADVDHVLDGAPHHPLGSRIGATTNGHHAGNGLDVGFDPAVGLAIFERAQVLFAPLRSLLRVGLQNLLDQRLVARLKFFDGGFDFGRDAHRWFLSGMDGLERLLLGQGSWQQRCQSIWMLLWSDGSVGL